MKNIFKEIELERKQQDEKFGKQDHAPIEWCAILGEEVGEVNKAALEAHFGYEIPTPAGAYFSKSGNSSERKRFHLNEYRKELIQVAAVAVSMIQCLDSNNE